MDFRDKEIAIIFSFLLKTVLAKLEHEPLLGKEGKKQGTGLLGIFAWIVSGRAVLTFFGKEGLWFAQGAENTRILSTLRWESPYEFEA